MGNLDPPITPNTETYALIERMGYDVQNDDPGVIYETLKFAGVPEYIAYTSAARNALKDKKTKVSERALMKTRILAIKCERNGYRHNCYIHY